MKPRSVIMMSTLGVMLAIVMFLGVRIGSLSCAFAAKIVCSAHFVGGRDPQDVLKQDTPVSSFVSVVINGHIVTATALWGLFQRSAFYRGSVLGCSIAPPSIVNLTTTPPHSAPVCSAYRSSRDWNISCSGADQRWQIDG